GQGKRLPLKPEAQAKNSLTCASLVYGKFFLHFQCYEFICAVAAVSAVAAASLAISLLPTIVKLRPICTATGLPSMVIVILPLRYHTSEPVENSLTGACMGVPLMTTSTGLACCRNWVCVMGHEVLTAMKSLLDGK